MPALLHLFPAAVCLLAAIMMGLSMRLDFSSGMLAWRSREAAVGLAIIGTCALAAAVSFLGAVQ